MLLPRQVAQVEKFTEKSGLGINLEANSGHHYIRSVLPEGPVGRCGKLFNGDELLEVHGHIKDRKTFNYRQCRAFFTLYLLLIFTKV